MPKDPILSALEDSIARDMDAIRLGPSYLLHQVVDTIVDHKLMAVEEIEEKLDEDEDAILKDASSYNLGSLMDSAGTCSSFENRSSMSANWSENSFGRTALFLLKNR